jgi:hypothetical protein
MPEDFEWVAAIKCLCLLSSRATVYTLQLQLRHQDENRSVDGISSTLQH